MSRKRKIEVLSVEDNPGDVAMIKALFGPIASTINLHFVDDGEKAMDYVKRRGAFTDVPRPDMVLLDLNLPKIDGKEILTEMKSDPELCCIPILVLSTSSYEPDVHRCYELHANCYFTKPNDLEEFNEVMKAIENCWIKMVSLPDYPTLSDTHRDGMVTR